MGSVTVLNILVALQSVYAAIPEIQQLIADISNEVSSTGNMTQDQLDALTTALSISVSDYVQTDSELYNVLNGTTIV